MSSPKKGDLSSSEKELFEVITAGKPLRLTLIPVEGPDLSCFINDVKLCSVV